MWYNWNENQFLTQENKTYVKILNKNQEKLSKNRVSNIIDLNEHEFLIQKYEKNEKKKKSKP